MKILQFRGDRIERETLYFADPFPAPDWRRPWAEEGAAEERQADLPAHVAAGNENQRRGVGYRRRSIHSDRQIRRSGWSGQSRWTRTRAPEVRTRTR